MKSWQASIPGILLMLLGAVSGAAETVVPAAPTKLQAMALRSDTIFLVWEDNSNDEFGFLIEESINGGPFVMIGTTGANTIGVPIGLLAPATTYSFRVRASNEAGDSAYSNEASATTRASDGPCTPSDIEICLNNDRFRIQALYQTSGDLAGEAHAVKLTSDSGSLWFFNEANVEAVINNRYWVFAGGLTNVRVLLAVVDTQRGTFKVYLSVLNRSFVPIQDTAAFNSCP